MTACAIFVVGPAGSGKSRVAKTIARDYRAVYLDKDVLATPLTELVLTEHGEDPHQRESSAFYRDHVFPAEYAALLRVAADNLAINMPVVLDAPFFAYLDDPHYLDKARAEAGWPVETMVYVIRVQTSERTVRSRLASRGLARDRHKLAHWESFWEMMRARECRWLGAEQIAVDNDGAEPDLRALRARLRLS